MISWRCFTVVLAGLLLLSCREGGDAGPEPRTAAEASPAAPRLPVAEPPLSREDLILAVIRAASAAALAADDRESQRLLDGKRFELRMRFGCDGPGAEAGAGRNWSFDEDKGVLRIRVRSDISADTPLLARLGLGGFEAVEGFWINRPWLLTAACPQARAAPAASPTAEAPEAGATATPDEPPQDAAGAAPTPPAPRVGIVQFFTASDARTHRRDNRDFEVTKTLAKDARPSGEGYDLVVSGRLQQLPDGRVIACAVGETEAAPPCIVAAEFDRVALVEPASGEVLAEWAGG